jgi:hypothetical protein
MYFSFAHCNFNLTEIYIINFKYLLLELQKPANTVTQSTLLTLSNTLQVILQLPLTEHCDKEIYQQVCVKYCVILQYQIINNVSKNIGRIPAIDIFAM